ncbi:hypothetical protein [Paenibacillus turpanensis]|uniref:hypothetical protein n=1 Tax=Paenibacillus turpanensis TaxID=2689078 RepID=UPI00140BED1E|nr:hypothetical protein [Paenibacillus turpanensis]
MIENSFQRTIYTRDVKRMDPINLRWQANRKQLDEPISETYNNFKPIATVIGNDEDEVLRALVNREQVDQLKPRP